MKGNIYKITYNDIIYVGSTMKCIHERFNGHIIGFSCYKDNYTTTLKPYFEKYGVNKFKVSLIKQYEVVDRKQLLAWEQLWINKLKCINKASPIPFLLKRHRRKIYNRKYRKRHLERIREDDRQRKRKMRKIIIN